MIRITPPRCVLREWMCCYCRARGPANSERNQIELTQAHLAGCAARKKYEVKIDAAMKAMENR